LVTVAQIDNRLSRQIGHGSWVWQRRKMPVPLIVACGYGFFGELESSKRFLSLTSGRSLDQRLAFRVLDGDSNLELRPLILSLIGHLTILGHSHMKRFGMAFIWR
jgi:hypothetical protein